MLLNIFRQLFFKKGWLFFFWGCPALRAGRAVRGLAVRSALRRLRLLGLAFGHPLPSLSLRRLRRLSHPNGPKLNAVKSINPITFVRNIWGN